MNKREKTLKSIAQYCQENIEDYEPRVQVALGRMDRWRTPLCATDSSLCCEIEDCIAEYCEEYGLDPAEIDAEDVIFCC